MKVAKIEALTKTSRDTLRYYERNGLLSPPKRNPNDYRAYSEINVMEINFIKKGQELGFTLAEIKHGLNHFRKHKNLCTEWILALKEKQRFFEELIGSDKKSLRKIQSILKS